MALDALTLSDIAVRTPPSQKLAPLIKDRFTAMLDPAFVPRLGADAQDHRLALGCGRILRMRPPGVPIVGMDECDHQAGICKKRGRRIARHFQAGGRHIEVAAAIGRQPILPVGGIVGQDSVFLFAFFQQGGALRHQVFQRIPQAGQLQMRAHPGADLVNVERLADVIGGAQVETLDLLLYSAHHGHKDDRNAVAHRRSLDPATDFVAIHLRHDDVEQDQIGRRRSQRQVEGFGPAGRHFDAIVVLKRAEQFMNVGRDIVHHQQGRPTFGVAMAGAIECQGIPPITAQLQLGAQPHPQQFGIDRLGQVVRNAQLEAARLVGGFGQRGDENDWNLGGRRIGFQMGEHRIAIHARHFDVEQNHVGLRRALRQFQRPFAPGGSADHIVVAQDIHQRVQILMHVIHDQHAGPAVGSDGISHGRSFRW